MDQTPDMLDLLENTWMYSLPGQNKVGSDCLTASKVHQILSIVHDAAKAGICMIVHVCGCVDVWNFI